MKESSGQRPDAFQAQELEFDLVVLDVMLPGLDGWHVLTRLRQGGRRAPVKALRAGWMKKAEIFAGKYPDSEDPNTVNHLLWYEATNFTHPVQRCCSAAIYSTLWYVLKYGRLAERLNAPVLLNRALSWKPGRRRESKSANPLGRSEATPSEG
jgi:CheY-like chemotaxis protein